MTPEQTTSLGNRIRMLREELNQSLGDLEKASGVTKGYLSQLERGEATNPSVEAIRKIAHGLGVAVTDLLGESTSYDATPGQRIPLGLRAFLTEAESRGSPLGDDDVKMLLGIQYRGRRPRSAQDWSLLFDLIKRITS